MKVQTIMMVALGVIIPAVMSSSNDCTKNPEWQAYKTKFNKHYESSDEENMRCEIWQKNVDEVQRHNLDETQTYKRGVNHFSDRTSEENKRSRGLVMPQGLSKQPVSELSQSYDNPSKWDWRDLGAVTPVKEQEDYKNSWAFAVTGLIETQFYNHTGRLLPFSEQQLVDCFDNDNDYYWTFFGQKSYRTFEYLQTARGLQTEYTYPYVGKRNCCRFNKQKAVKIKVDYLLLISSPGDNFLQNAIYTRGPVIVSVCSSQDTFYSYSGGVYEGGECRDENIDHAVLLVGYVNDGSSCYYIVKNSWGEKWGIDGYMHMACGKVLFDYPTIATISF